MEQNKQKLCQAFQLLGMLEEPKAETILKELVSLGDVEAKFTLAGMYLRGENGIAKNEKECIRLLKDAAENDHYEPAAGMLSAIYYEGLGTRVNYAESATYAKMVTDDETGDTEPWKGIIYNIMGLMTMAGNGITKNIPRAWHLLRYAIGLGSEDAQESLEKLQDNYPMTSDGRIDLMPRGRSKWMTFFLVMSILFFGLIAYNMWNEDYRGTAVVAGGYALVCLLTMLWVPNSVYGILAYFVIGAIGCPLYFFNAVLGSGDTESIPPAFIGTFGGAALSASFIFLSMQKRKKGCAHPWNILTKKDYDGRGPWECFTSKLLEYGEGDAFKTDAKPTQIATGLQYVFALVLVAMSGYAAWGVANADMSMDIEWNCFKNTTVYVPLCVIGFFLQFFNWTHLSYVTFWEWTDDLGKKHRERDRDMMTEIEGGFLMPLLGHLLVAPIIYGAMLYYVIMGGFALLQGVMPWVLAALTFASSYLAFRNMQKWIDRKLRFLLLPVTALFYFLIYAVIASACY